MRRRQASVSSVEVTVLARIREAASARLIAARSTGACADAPSAPIKEQVNPRRVMGSIEQSYNGCVHAQHLRARPRYFNNPEDLRAKSSRMEG